MSYHLRVVAGAPVQVWRIDSDIAVRVGVTNPEGGPGTYFKAEKGESIWDAIRRSTPWFEPDGRNPFHKTVLKPGGFYPRIARPIDQHPTDALGWNPTAQTESNVIAIARGQLARLARQLERICQTIHPTDPNFAAFGHDIRNLLILACTEVEAHWRGVLTANGVDDDHRLGTRDYVALNEAMKLDDYVVAFPAYPWLTPRQPFAGWGSIGKPTQELAWYDAYNAVKHRREIEFDRATLERLLDAISACAIMLVAQFGLPASFGEQPDLRSFFTFSAVPTWPLAEVYILPYGEANGTWSPVNYKFEKAR